jgi:hypothetical protein
MQETPVDSMATVVTPHAASQSAMACKSQEFRLSAQENSGPGGPV